MGGNLKGDGTSTTLSRPHYGNLAPITPIDSSMVEDNGQDV